ncbi:MAG TPA: PAS domain-containing protein, partial [Bryobacteraceae bacterium]|nr:PAS domain-containing protein [Bryobacteraceae bacterium]
MEPDRAPVMLWLYLLGVVTLLTIALRRVLRRQTPLDEELYSKKVAVEHVQSGVAWVRADGRIGSVNQSFANTFRCTPEQLRDQIWMTLFAEKDRERAREAYSQMLLAGIDSLECLGLRADGSMAWLNVRMVAVHDHHLRFAGHHCLIEDRTLVHQLEERLRLTEKA